MWVSNPLLSNKIRVNIGINSGKALVGFTRYSAISGSRVTFTATGRTTIVAARLQALARGGSVMVSGETLGRVADRQEFAELDWLVEDQGEVRLKNLAEPERVYRLRAPLSEADTHASVA